MTRNILQAQSYEVIEQIRTVGAELDLLCTHKVSGKTIYVECKAQKDPIAASVLRQLWGTVDSEDHSEGWIISTSPFSKDAKGFIENWKKKPKEKSSRLSFYYPELIIDSLKDAKVISEKPVLMASKIIGGNEFLGEWTLLVSTYGVYWCVYTLKGGEPNGVLLFNSSNGKLIQDKLTLDNLSCLESTLTNYDLHIALEKLDHEKVSEKDTLPVIVEVETGVSWDDYRPARPQDFIGRDATQKDILNFIDSAKKNGGSRVFAITGNSGLGKSSLIAKLRDRSRNKYYKNKYFVFAVDIRGARAPSYILSSLKVCLRTAQSEGFGKNIKLNLTDPSTPLTSPNIKEYLSSLEENG